eukprot:6983242-Alexandrium_andersonii.AAC.1
MRTIGVSSPRPMTGKTGKGTQSGRWRPGSCRSRHSARRLKRSPESANGGNKRKTWTERNGRTWRDRGRTPGE